MNTEMLSPPSGAIVLFDGANLDAWTKRDGSAPVWPIEDGALVSQGGDIRTRETFADFHLHIEFNCPDSPPHVTGQGQGNSGVFLQGRYEVQVLDSYNISSEPGKGDCGALYNAAAPLVNACRPPETWQTYDIFFRAPRFENGTKTANTRVTVLQNGQVVQNNVELEKQTGGCLDEKYAEPGPILLQDHGNLVRFRNVWLLPLPASGVDRY